MRRISTKEKKKLYSLSSLLFHLLVFIGLLIWLRTSPDENIKAKANTTLAEKEPATSFKAFFTSIKR